MTTLYVDTVSLGPDQKHRGVYSLPVSLCDAPQFLALKVRQMEKYLWEDEGRKRGREEERDTVLEQVGVYPTQTLYT